MAKRASVTRGDRVALVFGVISCAALAAFGLINLVNPHPPTWVDTFTYPVTLGVFVTIHLALRRGRTRALVDPD